MKAVILDMYGVVLKDTGDGFYEFVNQTFPEMPVADMIPHWELGNIGQIPSLQIFELLGYTGDLARIERAYLDSVEIDTAFYDFAAAVKSRWKLALISNDVSEWSHYLREKYQLNNCFDVITISGDEKLAKPDARIFQLTLERLGCSASECIYIDDRRHNLEAAQALGMGAILFNSRQVPYSGQSVTSFPELSKLLDLR